jgi:MSHA biogenesis protein MshO
MTRCGPHLFVCQRGFTLVEAIVVMVITGILSGIMVLFIRQPVKNYADAAGRADMSDTADLALRRMARELHSALPNSLRLSVIGGVSLLEFIPSYAGGQYVAVEDNINPVPNGLPLKFSNSATSFNVVGPMPPAPYPMVERDYIVVYNLGLGASVPETDAYQGGNRAQISASPNGISGTRITLDSNPFTVPSPGHRFQVAKQPVTFRCQNNASGTGTLMRYWNYGFQGAQADPSTLGSFSSAMMANNVLACDFTISQPANQRSGLVGLTIALARSDTGNGTANGLETLTLSAQVHVDNTP